MCRMLCGPLCLQVLPFKEPITGIGGNRYIIFEKSQWHCQCFNCKQCGTSLVGVNFVAEGYGDELEIYCQPCGFQKRGWETGGAGSPPQTSQAQQAEVPQTKQVDDEPAHERTSFGASKKDPTPPAPAKKDSTAAPGRKGSVTLKKDPAPAPKTSVGSKFGRRF